MEIDKKTYVWSISKLLIPVNRYELVPYRHVGDLDDGSHHETPYLYVDRVTHDALLAFEELRIGWNESEWDTWLFFIYPFLDLGLAY